MSPDPRPNPPFLRGEILSLHAGPVHALRYRGHDTRSAITKPAVTGPVWLSSLGLVGDEQADARYHGGASQALCVYADEHYAHWAELLGRELEPSAFGENLRSSGLTEAEVCIGDRFAFGEALVEVSAPRTPCYKPGVLTRAARLKQAMKDTGRVGFYLRVIIPGRVSAADPLVLTRRRWPELTVQVAYAAHRDRDAGQIRRLLAVPELAERFRAGLNARLHDA